MTYIFDPSTMQKKLEKIKSKNVNLQLYGAKNN